MGSKPVSTRPPHLRGLGELPPLPEGTTPHEGPSRNMSDNPPQPVIPRDTKGNPLPSAFAQWVMARQSGDTQH